MMFMMCVNDAVAVINDYRVAINNDIMNIIVAITKELRPCHPALPQ